MDLLAGLEIRRPEKARSGFFISRDGAVLTTTEAVGSCSRVTLDEDIDMSVAATDADLGLALVRPASTLAPISVARLATATPRLGSEVAVAGYSFEGALGAATLTFGTLEDVEGLGGEAQIDRLQLMAEPGDAGGPVEAFTGYEGAIEYRRSLYEDQTNPSEEGEEVDQVSASLFPSLDIVVFRDFNPAILPLFKSQIEGNYVLIGGDVVDFDRKDVTFTSVDGDKPAGIYVHAEMIAQMLDGNVMTQISSLVKWALAVLVVLTAVLIALLEWPARRLVPIMLVLFALFLGAPIALHVNNIDTFGLPAVGWLVGWVLAFAAMTAVARASGNKQRAFAQSALGKYIPRDIATQIIDQPELLSLGGEKRSIYVLFSDLEGFTKMSHAIEPEMVAKLLNRYLEMLRGVVLEHGGVIDKYVGDAVVAFWGAPISRPDDAERAAKAGYAIWEAGEAFRKEVAEMDPTLPKIGKPRVGLHFGEAVVGNFGGDTRIQYTALGDSMNTAARLESVNKALKTSVMASREFTEGSDIDWWRPMGRIVLSGRSSPVDIMEPAPNCPVEDRQKFAEAAKIAPEDAVKAQAIVDELIAKYPEDVSLVARKDRYANLSEGGAYVMGSK